MKFYNADFSPNCLRVRAVAAELGIELEIVDVDLRKGAPDAMKALNANGKVPVLDDNGFGLWESRAINAYLAVKTPRNAFTPTTLSRGRRSTNGRIGRPFTSDRQCKRWVSSAP